MKLVIKIFKGISVLCACFLPVMLVCAIMQEYGYGTKESVLVFFTVISVVFLVGYGVVTVVDYLLERNYL